MKENLSKVISDILTALYRPLWFALLCSSIFMFVYKQNANMKTALKQWLMWFKNEKKFRRVFFLAFYTVIVLFRTLFDRTLFDNPLSNVLGEWGFYEEVNGQIVFNANVPENFIMLVPFIFLLFFAFKDKILKYNVSFLTILWKSSVISFLFSLTIENLQLLLHLGTWQLSDLVYNTLGGVFGGVVYYITYIIAQKRRRKKKNAFRGGDNR